MISKSPGNEKIEGAADLHAAQAIMLYILSEVDRVCRKNSLDYWLDGGTLLGAVRHGGFIPWDDDVDLVMPRPDYERFLQLAELELPDSLFVQTTQSDTSYRRYATPCKIRHKHSRVIEKDIHGRTRSDLGLFVDIIPIDKYHVLGPFAFLDSTLKRCYHNLCSFHHAVHLQGRNPRAIINNALVAARPLFFVEHLLKYLKKFIINRFAPYSFNQSRNFTFGYSYDSYWFRYFSPGAIYPLREINFANLICYAPNDYDAVLRIFYGDYHHIPEVHERPEPHYKILELDMLPKHRAGENEVQPWL